MLSIPQKLIYVGAVPLVLGLLAIGVPTMYVVESYQFRTLRESGEQVQATVVENLSSG
ncbi:MAG: hypothetical protein AAGG51_13845 [Cyanobacteria bacterium P01_G01_bin.54]